MISKTTVVSLWSKLRGSLPLAIATVLIVTQACQPTGKVAQSQGDYYEDLTAYMAMPKVDSAQITDPSAVVIATPQTTPDGSQPEFIHDVTTELQNYIDTLSDIISKNPYLPGYWVQVYTGSNRDEAYDAKEAVYMLLPDADPEVTYEQPVYKVKVGWYRERLEAERVYLKLHRKIASTIVIPERKHK